MPPEPIILSFDTAAAHCAAALLKGDRVLVERTVQMTKGQAERLLPMLEDLLSEQRLTWSDLTAIGVGIGPGNFTGIRISVSAARGLALALGIPAIGVSGLVAQAEGTDDAVISLLDARREQVYWQTFSSGKECEPALADLADLPRMPDVAAPTVIGHGAEEIAKKVGGQAKLPVYPMAVAIARIASRNLSTTAPRPAPLYVRSADAAPPRDPAPVILP